MTLRVEGTSENLTHLMVPALYFSTAIIFAGRSLGLKMLSSESQDSTDAKDVERYDTLCDVNMSCIAAVDALNDILCYE